MMNSLEVYLVYGGTRAAIRSYTVSYECYVQEHDYEAASSVLEKLIEVADECIELVSEVSAELTKWTTSMEHGIAVDHLLSLFLVKMIERKRDAAIEVMQRLSKRLHGHSEQARS